jgi:ribonuclease G
MRKRIVINADPHATRIAILEENELVELLVERGEKTVTSETFYKGRVNAVLPGMQAAFVEIGLTRPRSCTPRPVGEPRRLRRIRRRRRDASQRAGAAAAPRRSQDRGLPQEGPGDLVQVTKESIGTKGPRVTSRCRCPGASRCSCPASTHFGVSRRIEDRGERSRLKRLGRRAPAKGAGLIVRTAATARATRVRERRQVPDQVWEKVEKKAKTSRAPS